MSERFPDDPSEITVTDHAAIPPPKTCERCEGAGVGFGRAIYEVNDDAWVCGRCYGILKDYFVNPEENDPVRR